MRILVNGDWRDIAAPDLAAALVQLGYGGSVVATALNGEFVPGNLRSISALSEGDRVDVVAPVQGG